MYPVVLSFIPFSCWRAFPKVGKARIFYGAGTLGIRAEENPRPEPGAGEILGFHLKKLSGGHRGGRSGGR